MSHFKPHWILGFSSLFYAPSILSQASLKQAEQYLKNGQFEAARGIYEQECDVENIFCINQYSVALIVQGEYAQALQKLEQISDSVWLPVEYYRNKGLCHYFLNDIKSAEESYRLGIAAGDALANANLAYLMIMQSRFDEAETILSLKAENEEMQYWTLLYSGLLDLRRSRHLQAEKKLTALLKKFTGSFDGYLYRANVYYRQRKYNEAKADLARADLIIPGNSETRELHMRLNSLPTKN